VSLRNDIQTLITNLDYLCLTVHYIDKDFNFSEKNNIIQNESTNMHYKSDEC
jgi:hypothetical protein